MQTYSNKTWDFKPLKAVLLVFRKMKSLLYNTDDCVLGRTALVLPYFLSGFHRAKHTMSVTIHSVLNMSVINTVVEPIYGTD